MPCEETIYRWRVVAGHYKEAKMKYWLVKKEKGAEYNYTHIISKLLTKQGWLRVPWFVSWKEKPDGR